MSLSADLESIPRLFGDAIEQLGKLVQNEAQLARAELSEKVAQASIGVGYLAAAAILCVPVLVLGLMALALWFVALGLAPATAHLAAAGIGAVIAGILAVVGSTYLKPRYLAPTVTLQQIERDVVTVKEFMK